MGTTRIAYSGIAAIVIAVSLTAYQAPLSAQQSGGSALRVGANDLGGTVASRNGPEAGVWVIAETNDLPTKFAKLVVTDDRGRYLIPGLPKGKYSVWVRGYGLVDSRKLSGAPGKTLNLTAVPAPSAAAAAEYYPGMYWYSMINIPGKQEFPGTGEKGNGISSNIKSQEQWVDTVKNACQSCHSLGSKGMRTVPKEFGPGVAGWARRTQSGQALTQMALGLGYMGADAALKNYADWTDRIAAGELPFGKPERPKGVERNMVVTMWDFSTPKYYLHDGISTDRNNPRLNANGPIYGAPEESTDQIPAPNPDFCKKGSDHPSAKVVPLDASVRQVSVYDPKTGKWQHVDTCFTTHHLYFGHDANKTLWLSQGGPQSGVVGWVNTKMFLETGDSARSQGWTPVIVDTNGNGRRDDGDTRLTASFYGIMPSPVDDSVWGQSMGIGFGRMDQPGYVMRLVPGPNP